MKSMTLVGLLVPAAALVGSQVALSAAPPNLVNDGGFETAGAPPGSYAAFSPGQRLGGWTVTGAAGNVAVVSSSFIQAGFTFPAADGDQFLDLTGDVDGITGQGITQTISTIPGETYSLKFSVGNVVDTRPPTNFGSSSTVTVLWNGSPIMRAVNAGGGTTLAWKVFTRTLRATSNRTTLGFVNDDPATDTANGLDAISLTGKVQARGAVVGKLVEIKGANLPNGMKPELTIRRGGTGQAYPAYESTDIRVGDVLTTNANTVAAIELSLGGRVGLNTNSEVTITGPRGVAGGPDSVQVDGGSVWAKLEHFSKVKTTPPLEISPNGGVTGIKG